MQGQNEYLPLQLIGVASRLILCEHLDAPRALTIIRLLVYTRNSTTVTSHRDVHVAV